VVVVQAVEGVEEFVLRGLLAGEEVDVIDQEQVAARGNGGGTQRRCRPGAPG
jgi:hypothetical protein